MTQPSAEALFREGLLQAALELPFRGWDFSVIGDRLVVEPPHQLGEDI